MNTENILSQAYQEINEDAKFIRLATVTTISHSLIFILLVLYNVYLFLEDKNVIKIDSDTLLQYLKKLFLDSGLTEFFIIIMAVLAIGYYFIYPIGEASMIKYLNSEDKKGWKSIAFGFLKFFPMFELHGILSVFNMTTFSFMVLRAIRMDILQEPIILVLMGIRLSVIIAIALLTPYAKYYIIIDDEKLTDAVRKSMITSIENIGITIKYVFIGFLLQLRFILNVAVVTLIPAALIYLAFQFDIVNEAYTDYVIYGTTIALILMMAYINGIIEAFFINYRHKIFMMVKK